jgi:AcrR family transcriptional regulator
VVPANLYNYYASKEAILADVLTSSLREQIRRQNVILAAGVGPMETMYLLSYVLVKGDLESEVWAFTAYQGTSDLGPENADLVHQLMVEVRHTWRDVVKQGLDEGLFQTADVRLTALSVLTMCSFVSSWYRSGGRLTAAKVADHVATTTLRSLGFSGELPHAELRRLVKRVEAAIASDGASQNGPVRQADTA